MFVMAYWTSLVTVCILHALPHLHSSAQTLLAGSTNHKYFLSRVLRLLASALSLYSPATPSTHAASFLFVGQPGISRMINTTRSHRAAARLSLFIKSSYVFRSSWSA